MNRLRLALINATIAILVAVVVIVTVASLWFRNAVYSDRALPERATAVVIPRDATFSDVRTALEQNGILAHPLAFRILAKLRHDEEAVKAGEYRFPPHQSSDEVLRRLVRGEQSARWVTIPEGFTAREIAATLAAHDLGDRDALTRALVPFEGRLFPDTYLVPTGVSPPGAARIFTDQFARELPPDADARAHRVGLSVEQVITLASLVEREAKADDERPLMAGVYYNRLRAGMPLEVDATIEYIFPEHHDVITTRDLQIDSPYNTYRHTGLPPTPIANPGKPSIDAAFMPRASDYLYYVYKGNGHHAFARTLAEHNANVARYLP